jgi:NAD+ kinase
VIITLGGDGTILYAVNKFIDSIPNIIGINMGTLGFMCYYKKE